MLSHYTESLDQVDTQYNFGTFDNRGRSTGAKIRTCRRIMIEYNPEEEKTWGIGGYRLPAGEYFVWCPHTTRNGAYYGPVQTEQFCASLAERDAAIAKYLKDAAKRASKLAAKAR